MSVEWSATWVILGVLGYEISDSGRYSAISYPGIQIPVEITSCYLIIFPNFGCVSDYT